MDLSTRCRPKTINEVWANEKTKETLTNLLANDNRPQVYLFTGHAGCGKAQPVDTIIPTPAGNRRFGDLKVGDYVFDRNGDPTKVIGVYDRGMLDTYRVLFKDGRSTLCNDDHLWTVTSQKNKRSVLSVADMLSKGVKTPNNTSRYAVDMNKAVEYTEHTTLPVNPYVVGAFLANGCCTGTQLVLSTNDEFIVAKCAQLLDVSYKKLSDYNYSWTFCKEKNKDKSDKLLSCKGTFAGFEQNMCVLAHEKSIPYMYMHSTVQHRLLLLQGLLDGDGTVYDNYRLNVCYSTSSYTLACDVVNLCLSLGISAHIMREDSRHKHINYTVYISMPNKEKHTIFSLPRKLDVISRYANIISPKRYDLVGITAIENLNYKSAMRCIKVDNEEELYLTNDFIVTHNTTLARAYVNDLGVNSVDVTELNMSDMTGVDAIRNLIEESQYMLTDKKAYILDEVQFMSASAQSAALKMLEEPAKDVYYMLCTTDPQKLSTALKSRCIHIKVDPINIDEMPKYLRRVCKAEGIDASIEVLEAIAERVEGVPRDALKLLDKVAGLEEDKALQIINETATGEAEDPDIRSICQELLKGGSWKTIAANLKNIKSSDAEGTRRMIAGYMSAVILNSANTKAACVLSYFTDNFYDSGFSGLVLACFSAYKEVKAM